MQSALALVLDQRSIAEAVRSLEINANILRRWIKEYQVDDDDGQNISWQWKTDTGTRKNPTSESTDQATQTGKADINISCFYCFTYEIEMESIARMAMLDRLLPNRLPRAMSSTPRHTAAIDTAASGRKVAVATNRVPTKLSLQPMISAISLLTKGSQVPAATITTAAMAKPVTACLRARCL
ncbi:hypothetical protein SAMN05428952_10594 [Nitrosomonas sp. Nm132]|nr:hypothetical protein SAMN05428952_10594 [Nitrosomonas sp. Nm132]